MRIETWETVTSFNRDMFQLFGQQKLAEAEAIILDGLTGERSAIAQACADLPLAGVTLVGWTELVADIARIDALGSACTALCFDLSDHEVGDEPALETSFYDDSAFEISETKKISVRDPAAISQAALSGTKPWQGRFLDITRSLRIVGLQRPLRAISGYGNRHVNACSPLPADYPAYLLIVWFTYLRLSQAVARDIESCGLPRAMPVIVGQHDFGPDFTFVHMVDLIRDDRRAVDAQISDRNAKGRSWVFDHIEEQLEYYRRGRGIVSEFGRYFLSEGQKLNIESREAGERRDLRLLGMPFDKPTFRMSDREFDDFAVRFADAWKRKMFPDTDAPAVVEADAPAVVEPASPPVIRKSPLSFGRKVR